MLSEPVGTKPLPWSAKVELRICIAVPPLTLVLFNTWERDGDIRIRFLNFVVAHRSYGGNRHLSIRISPVDTAKVNGQISPHSINLKFSDYIFLNFKPLIWLPQETPLLFLTVSTTRVHLATEAHVYCITVHIDKIAELLCKEHLILRII